MDGCNLLIILKKIKIRIKKEKNKKNKHQKIIL